MKAVAVVMLLFVSLKLLAETESRICRNVIVRSEGSIEFSKAETDLLCGNPSLEGWKQIPPNQIEYNAKVFLQNRGFHFPKFSQKDSAFIIDTGPLTKVRGWRLQNAPPRLETSIFRGIIGAPLTPSLLGLVESQVGDWLQENGWPCGTVKTEGNPLSGEIVAFVETGKPQVITGVVEDPVTGIHPKVLRRYDAFRLGELYDSRLFALTSRRTVEEGVVESSFFTQQCPDSSLVHQQLVSGAPRLVVVGAGINTDKGLMGKASWKNTRLGATASSIELQSIGSIRSKTANAQEFLATGEWYFLSQPSRWHGRPRLSLKHDSTEHFNIVNLKSELDLARTWDSQTVGVNGQAGPLLIGTRTYRGEGREKAFWMGLGLAVSVTSHDFELFRNKPQDGFQGHLTAQASRKNVFSDLSALYLVIDYQHLWNLVHYRPPLFVLGIRAKFGTTLYDREENSARALPQLLKHYLGGSGDLRGFGFQELPGPQASVTILTAGCEGRFAGLLPWGVQPFAFVDAGALSREDSFRLNSPLFWSPGIGIRWESPIGAFRTTLSHGFLAGNRDGWDNKLLHWQWYLGYGDEF